ncbi:alpha/beta hydrolase [Leptolyngbya sp. O-77]|uniref:alpha/beta hydrolase n=1 Tax=Leptolyngbya sp. O-77 TaxID=1080068 RepID=UPI00074D3B75|nr:alpha/beta hydrolase [Leptolyngbya sp. O-77]BAU42778.1 Carboxylesterase NlhH [Leptolyngbya sp. O-77]
MSRVAGLVILLLSGVGLFLSLWTVVPAPTLALLPLGVGAPEISPLLMLVNGQVGLDAVVLFSASRRPAARRMARSAIALSLAALLLSSIPLVQLPGAIQRAAQAMQTTLGDTYDLPGNSTQNGRSRPFVFSDLIRGIPVAAEVTAESIEYAAADGTPLRLVKYQPVVRPSEPMGAIAAIYGGAWRSGDADENAHFNRYLAARGYTVIALDYRHAPEHPFPAQLQDVQQGLQLIRQRAAEWGVEGDRLALLGWSAGAHLATLVAFQPDAVPVRGIVGYYGPVDLAEGYRNPPRPDPINTRALLEDFLSGTPDTEPAEYRAASPITYVRPGLPPVLLIYGDRDHVVKPEFGQQLYQALRANGNTAALIRLPWAEHAFDAIFRGIGNQIALYHVERFLDWAIAQ